MAASTITRDTLTNDTGSAAAPNADGTVLNNNFLQNNVYARIDAMFAGTGTYATLTVGGKFAAEGFGAHTFSSAGTGEQSVRVRNTTAGTGNYAAFWLGNDASATQFGIFGYSSTYTTSGPGVASGLQLYSAGVGGISIAAQSPSGTIRFYAGGTTLAGTISTAGAFTWVGSLSCGSVTGAFALASVQSSALTGTNNDLVLTSTTNTLEITPTGAVTLTGVGGGAIGRRLTIINMANSIDAVTISLDSASSTAANRFKGDASVGGDSIIINPGRGVDVAYSTTDSRWHILVKA